MAKKKLPHIFLSEFADTILFKLTSARGSARIPARDRQQHGRKLQRDLDRAWRNLDKTQKDRAAISLPTREGFYLEFKSQAGHDLVTKSLEDLRQKVRLLNVKKEGQGDDEITIATVYVPAGKESYFLNKISAYAENEKNVTLSDSIEDIRLAVLDSFWQDDKRLIPRQEKRWCEVWLRTGKGEEQDTEAAFRLICADSDIECGVGALKFPERLVLLVKSIDTDLSGLIESSPSIAEFRLSKEVAGFWVELPNEEQAAWAQELLDRTTVNDSNVSVCVLDTGVNNGHPLLAIVLKDDDCHSFHPDWGTHDHDPQGHGTPMCGVAIYGDLQELLLSNDAIEINHKLESVKIFRPGEENPKELWGHITSQAVSRAEIKNPDALRINCMAVTADDNRDRGRPSSWSASIDARAAGYDEENIKRLFIISAGNIQDSNEWKSYPDSNLTNAVHDPGQAWNALTVGGITNKTNLNNPDYKDYTPIAPFGGLSPFSTTSLLWERRKWPIKPEIVLEGGNAAKDKGNFVTALDDLSVLTTHHNIQSRHFTTMNATSAATAEASRMAAIIQSQYPEAWPETIRALMVHSAHWTDELKQQFDITDSSSKTDYSNFLRTCGYGVPDLERALYCAGNTLTLIAQETLQPYDKKEKDKGSGHRTKDMHVYELPWPKDILLAQGDLPVELRITLSYFVEPGPGEIGWKDRYRYPSYGLRFDLNNPTEDKGQFVRRLNVAARTEDEGKDSTSDSDRWLIGSNARNVGSIHSDIWKGTAAEMATCNMVGIFPIIGWWRERAYLDRWNHKARYSLIVSLHTEEQKIDIYTPVSIAVKTPISIKIP